MAYNTSLTGLQTSVCQPFFIYFWIFLFITPSLLVVGVWNVKLIYGKSLAVNFIEGSYLTFDQCFNAKLCLCSEKSYTFITIG